ncbi:uncharacterized protein LOC125378285 [Haliotis rufescens]|uniref:uncharacterized protein LOC125378285 n=1 Tax=Haliotis rufescens TaxID=6454 RepID=UPI00201F83BB|nr:uncharacterized protein LOC125378285 [Haliotis rufescens]
MASPPLIGRSVVGGVVGVGGGAVPVPVGANVIDGNVNIVGGGVGLGGGAVAVPAAASVIDGNVNIVGGGVVGGAGYNLPAGLSVDGDVNIVAGTPGVNMVGGASYPAYYGHTTTITASQLPPDPLTHCPTYSPRGDMSYVDNPLPIPVLMPIPMPMASPPLIGRSVVGGAVGVVGGAVPVPVGANVIDGNVNIVGGGVGLGGGAVAVPAAASVIDGNVNIVGGGVVGGAGYNLPAGLSVDGDVNIVAGTPGVNMVGGASYPAYYGDGVDISRPDVSDNYVVG